MVDLYYLCAIMNKEFKETVSVRTVSVGLSVLALAVFKPFGLESWQWKDCVHLLLIFVLGMGICVLSEIVMRYVLRMPHSLSDGVDYIIRRNLLFQIINTPLEALMICLYRHFMLSDRMPSNLLSWTNYLETLAIIVFCSFFIGLYWRFKFRSRYLAAELEESRRMNEQLQQLTAQLQQEVVSGNVRKEGMPQTERCCVVAEDSKEEEKPRLEDVVTLSGSTSEEVRLRIGDLLCVEAVGNYMRVHHLNDGKVREVMLRATSKQMEEELGGYPFIVRCHRAFLVNLAQVEQIVSKSGNMQLLMRHSHSCIPVSRSNVPQVKEALRGREGAWR